MARRHRPKPLPRKALGFCARTVASGLNGYSWMASARKMELCNRPPCAERKALWRDSDTVAVAGIDDQSLYNDTRRTLAQKISGRDGLYG